MRLKINLRTVRWLGAVAVLLFCGQTYADLVLTAPPRESPERGEEMYGSIAKLLTKRLGVRVVYEHPLNWIEYTTKMKLGKYDIVFDGPHFAAWRVKHLKHVPIVKLPGMLSFVVVAHADDQGITDPKSITLRAERFCGLASPNLGTMSLLASFDNPVIQPDVYEVANMNDVMTMFDEGRCRAAVLQDRYFNKLPQEKKNQLKVIYKSPTYPDQTITASKRISERQREVMVSALTAREGVPEAKMLLQQFAKQAQQFNVAGAQEYDGMENLLEGVLWGW